MAGDALGRLGSGQVGWELHDTHSFHYVFEQPWGEGIILAAMWLTEQAHH